MLIPTLHSFTHCIPSYMEFNMQTPIHCPKCQSTDITLRDHEQQLKKIGGVLLSSAGATAGTVGGAASGASIGAAVGIAVAGPLGIIAGGAIGTFVGAIGVGITGGFLGNIYGKKAGVIIDKKIFLDFKCNHCAYKFKEIDNQA
jgi:predicted nucleic-acid-binding Zn-ribbon protein